jgi:hydrogenase maturation protein HypF
MGNAATACQAEAITRLALLVQGVVQGVGFRPFLYRRAAGLGLGGRVANTSAGVRIEVEGPTSAVQAFVAGLAQAAPAGAAVKAIATVPLAPTGQQGFSIAASSVEAGTTTGIPRDLAPCPECLQELHDPADRRYRYPFITCVACGPRYSILATLPFDRCRTAMAAFPPCPACAAEYSDPANRRFHAETIACPACGPQLTWLGPTGVPGATGEDALQAAVATLLAGQVVALKGLGGFQLLVDAGNARAVAALRERKRRPEKPLALLVADLAAARALACIDAAEAALLGGTETPIVLLRRRPDASVALAEAVAPGNPWLGLMLPATPLHHLLATAAGIPLVATSANLSGEPLLYGEDAPEVLRNFADGVLTHDRAILQPVDDSVARLAVGRPLLLRRARGYAPAAIPVAGARPGLAAAGGYLKNTVAVATHDAVVLGPHIGDLESHAARDAHRQRLAWLVASVAPGTSPTAVRDAHPDFVISPPDPGDFSVQHHVAHVAACMAEHGLKGPVLGVAFDGAGYGPDGSLWGGEFLKLEQGQATRVAHLRPFPLPGGAAAMRQPWRCAAGALFAASGADAVLAARLPGLDAARTGQLASLATLMADKVNAPLTSSVGRLFDAAAALLGLQLTSSYEGQAAMALEWAAQDLPPGEGYAFPLLAAPDGPTQVDFAPALAGLLRDRDRGVPVGPSARRWHDGLAAAIVAVAKRAGLANVALAGGCFQNRVLLERTVALLSAAGFRAWWPQAVPPNDGGLALGQVAWVVQRQGAA